MAILWLNLVIVFCFSLFARYYAKPAFSPVSITTINLNKIFVLGTMLSLSLISGLRANIGDTYFYKYAYEFNDFTWDQVKDKDNIGFWILQLILKQYSDDPQILIFTTAAITNILIIIIFMRYSRQFEISTYIYN